MAVEVGMGYVSIVPEVRGFTGELQRQITGPAQSAGQDAGGAAGEGFTGKMGGVLKGGLVAVGLAAAAVLVKGFKDALDQGAISGKIQAQLGSTPQDAARYGKAAGQLYAHGVTDSVEDAAAAISGVMRSGILPPDATNAQIEAITGRVADLAKTFDLDLGQTANSVGQILKNGLAKDGAEALDILTAGMQRMGPRADDMADTFNEYSTKFRDLGLSGAEAMGLLSQGMQAGARDTDVVADALKEFQIRATDGSNSSAEAFQAIGLNAEEMTRKIAAGGPGAKQGLQQVLDGIKAIKDPAERNAAAVGLFGTKAEDLGQALFSIDPKTAVKALGDTADAADKMGDALHTNASARITQFKRSLEVGVTNFIGGKVLPPLMSLAGTAKDVIGPALSNAKSVVGGFFRSFSSGAGGQSIAAAGKTLFGLGTTVRDTLDPSVSAFIGKLKTGFLPALQGLWSVVSTRLLPALMSLHSAIFSAVAPVFTNVALLFTQHVLPAVLRVYTAVAENVKPIFAALADFVTGRLIPAVKMIGGKLAELVRKAQPIISVGTTIVSWLGRLVASIVGAVVPAILRFAGPVFSALFSAIGTAIGWIGNVVGFVGKLASAFLGAVRAVANFAAKAKGTIGAFLDWMRGFPGRIRQSLGNFGRLLIGKGKDLVIGLWNGVVGMGTWLRNRLFGWARAAIPGPIARALGIHSPSRLMRDEIGRFIPAGVIAGIDDEQSELDTRIQSMVRVPRIDPVRLSGPVRVPEGSTPRDAALSELVRALESERGREIVVRVGETEIARAVLSGQRQLARR